VRRPAPIAIVMLMLSAASASAATVAVSHEPPEGILLLGQRIRVDDGTCPAGQVKEVTGARLTEQGVMRKRVCVKR
jgi:hypothetical protein